MLLLFEVLDGSDNHTSIERQSSRILDFEDNDSSRIVELVEPIWIDDKDEIHSNIIEEVIPKLGMEFETEQEAYNFCNNYDRVVGFSIRQSKGQKNGLHA
jgi:hypothetical protein